MNLPELKNPHIFQKLGRVDAKSLESCDQLLLILTPKPAASHFKQLPSGDKMQRVLRKLPAGSTPTFTTRLSNVRQTLVVSGSIAKDASIFEQLTLGRKLVAEACGKNTGSLGICVIGFSADQSTSIYNCVIAAALAAAFQLPSFKSKKSKAPIKSLRLLGAAKRIDTSRVEAEAKGNNLARWLTTMPPNKMDAIAYSDLVRTLAKANDWSFKRYGTKELTQLGAGAFLAVAQGNDNDSAGILRLRYRPSVKTKNADLSLVGKGIIFDTGGTNLKPFQSMLDMHGDMQGSAVAVGTLLAISELQLPIAVDCWLAITENRTGPNAYKSQDVVTAVNGKTIQTVHTDAEGRMALADTLVLASRDKPAIIFDYATLTGSCVTAITAYYSGVFTNRADLHPHLKHTGRISGERVWPFPIGKEFMADLKSETADFLQCSPKAPGDHILAASFLAEFVENDTPWVHMDLSASDNDGGLGHVGSKFTGFGVRYTMSVILDDNLFKANL
ncbi:MAG: leucyl aminopeptidase family protein [Gammaproteobacteria bacterium]|jgi:leucyl aminopeptidase|nr:leucyl aminopeptidase family protein [Gammaproteobacteria bacterium]